MICIAFGKPAAGAPTEASGSSDLIVMTYALQNADYEFYWLGEYDVRFTGPWRHLFDVFAKSPATDPTSRGIP